VYNVQCTMTIFVVVNFLKFYQVLSAGDWPALELNADALRSDFSVLSCWISAKCWMRVADLHWNWVRPHYAQTFSLFSAVFMKIWLSIECVRTDCECGWRTRTNTSSFLWKALERSAKYWVRPHSDPVRVSHPHWTPKRQFSYLQIS